MSEPKFVGVIPERKPLEISMVQPPANIGWTIHETVGVVIVNKWAFGWRGALRRFWLKLRSVFNRS